MQKNYATILAKIDELIRKGRTDELARIYLETCVVGSADVITHTRGLLGIEDISRETVKTDKLASLVEAMRKDLGLSKAKINITGIFPAGGRA
jgi:hypothetical protein